MTRTDSQRLPPRELTPPNHTPSPTSTWRISSGTPSTAASGQRILRSCTFGEPWSRSTWTNARSSFASSGAARASRSRGGRGHRRSRYSGREGFQVSCTLLPCQRQRLDGDGRHQSTAGHWLRARIRSSTRVLGAANPSSVFSSVGVTPT